MAFAGTWMDLEIIILSKVRKTNTIWYYLYVESKLWHKWTELWDKQAQIKNKFVLAKEGRTGSLELADANHYT